MNGRTGSSAPTNEINWFPVGVDLGSVDPKTRENFSPSNNNLTYERSDFMFVYNFKLNGKLLVKFLLTIIAIVITAYFAISTYKIYSNSFKIKNSIPEPDVINLTCENYTNVLKAVHDDVDSYIGKKICFTGYIYRLIDFKDTEFVLARDMIISSNMQTLIVGFLCDCKNANNFENETWVEITGVISKGNYHGEIPVIKIKDIKQIDKPKDNIYVFPPDDSYLPTSNIF